MRYLSFTIENYKAIVGPLVIEVGNKPLVPIIGINESGKTTILHAIFAFDHFNDSANEGRHLKDTNNLYKTTSPEASVEALVETNQRELMEILTELEASDPVQKAVWTLLKRKRPFPGRLRVKRNIKTLEYRILTPPFNRADIGNALARECIRNLPFILFFDDFRDKVDEKILINPKEKENPSGWLGILEQLFRRTDTAFSVFDLPAMEERQRKSVLAKVQRYLNGTLTQEWQNFRLDDREALEIAIDVKAEKGPNNVEAHFVTLHVIERDLGGDDHYFFISDRSKGFFWFFNFVMKLQFNPKVLSEENRSTVYLLDEPGSYLHASAQSKLCSKLRMLSDENRVVYCTHSHYLLNPEVISLSSIHVADKDEHRNVTLVSIHDYKGSILDRRSAFQPVLDALQIKPFLLDLTHSHIVVVEGIFDYYAMEIFRNTRPIGILPSVGAESIKFYISLLIAWQVKFQALWDADDTGRREKNAAEKIFGSELASRAFQLLPCVSGKDRIMQDLFVGEDLRTIREKLDLPPNCSFEKTIASLFFSSRRGELVAAITTQTKQNFEELFRSLRME